MATMFGWLRLAALWASRRKRSTKLGSRAYSAKRTFTATGRSSRRSRARYTSAIPPRAMPRWISYRFEKTSASCVIGTKPYLWAPVRSWRSLPQDLAHHLRRDRRRDAPARRLAARAPAMLDEDGHDDLRVVGGREPYEPRVRAAGLVLGGACLARHRDARDPGGLPCAALDDGDHERRLGQSGLRRHRSAPRLRVDGLHRVVVGVGDPVGDVGLHDHAVVRDRRRSQRHLQRGHGDVTLTDAREREQGLVLLERPGRGAHAVGRAGRDVQRRRRADPELLHPGHELVAEVESDLPERRVARLLEAQRQRSAAALTPEVLQCVRRLRQLELGQLREVRLGRELPGPERHRSGDDLERRAVWVPLAVRAWQIGLVGVGAQELLVVLCDLRVVARERLRVVAGVGVHGQDAARLRVHHDDGSVLAAERVLRRILELLAGRQHDVADGLLAREHVGDVPDLEQGIAARELVVVRALDAHVPEHERLVARELREEGALRVEPLELELVSRLDRSGDDLAVGCLDLAARLGEVTQLESDVARIVGELVGVVDLQVGQLSDEQQDQDRDPDPHPPDGAVHRRASARARAVGLASRTADSSEIRRSSAMTTKLAISEEPPYDTNGSVTPVRGMRRVTPPRMTNVWMPMMLVRPAANSFGNGRSAWTAMRNPAATSSRNAIRIATVPSSPSSSPIAAQMKSVDAFGILSGLPSPRPVPAKPPDPNENRDWTI